MASWKNTRDLYNPVHYTLERPAPTQRSEKAGVAWVVVIGVAFIGIFTSWFGTQSFAVKLLNTGGKQLGSWLIGIVYVVFILSNQVAPSIVGRIGAKWTMVAGSVGYLLVVAGTASQNAHLTLVGGACVGFGAGLLWSGQGRMVTDLSSDSTRGFCWGIFDALMMGGSGYALRHRAILPTRCNGRACGALNSCANVQAGWQCHHDQLCAKLQNAGRRWKLVWQRRRGHQRPRVQRGSARVPTPCNLYVAYTSTHKYYIPHLLYGAGTSRSCASQSPSRSSF